MRIAASIKPLTKQNLNYTKYFNDQQAIELFYSYYKKDIELFNYTF